MYIVYVYIYIYIGIGIDTDIDIYMQTLFISLSLPTQREESKAEGRTSLHWVVFTDWCPTEQQSKRIASIH